MDTPIIVNQPQFFMPGDKVRHKDQPERGIAEVIKQIGPRQWLVKWPDGSETGLLLANIEKVN